MLCVMWKALKSLYSILLDRPSMRWLWELRVAWHYLKVLLATNTLSECLCMPLIIFPGRGHSGSNEYIPSSTVSSRSNTTIARFCWRWYVMGLSSQQGHINVITDSFMCVGIWVADYRSRKQKRARIEEEELECWYRNNPMPSSLLEINT